MVDVRDPGWMLQVAEKPAVFWLELLSLSGLLSSAWLAAQRRRFNAEMSNVMLIFAAPLLMKTIFFFFFHRVPFSEYKTAFIIQHSSPLASLICFSEAITFSPVISTDNSSGLFFFFKYRWVLCKIIYGVCDFFFFKANSFLPSCTAEGLKVTHLSASIFPALCCRAEFFQYVRGATVLNTPPPAPALPLRHSDKSQHRETEVYLHSASIHFWSRRFGIEFFFFPSPPFLSSASLPSLLPAPSSPFERGYDLRGSQISTLCFFFFLLFFPRGSLIQLESVQAQWILA